MITLILLILLIYGEIATFIKIGGAIGVGWTIFLTLAAAITGVVLLKQQGLNALKRMQEQMEARKVPLRESHEVLCLLLGAILLIIPGFITGVLGLLLFVPQIRRFLFDAAKDMQLEKLGWGYTAFTYMGRKINKNGEETTIEAQYTRVDDKNGRD